MKKQLKKLGVLTSGGDAPGMNAAIRAIVRSAVYNGLEVTGIHRGYTGLINGEFQKFNGRSVANIIQKGGTILETSRCNDMFTVEGRKKAIDALKAEGIGGCIVIGGNGSFRAATAMSEESDVAFIGVPGTIDNDIWGTDYTIGFNTAVNTALDAIDRIIGGLEKRNKIISPHEKSVIAFHEAGHAAVSWLLEYAHPLVKVTIDLFQMGLVFFSERLSKEDFILRF